MALNSELLVECNEALNLGHGTSSVSGAHGLKKMFHLHAASVFRLQQLVSLVYNVAVQKLHC